MRKAVRISEETIPFEVRSGDGSSIDHPELLYALWSEHPLREDLVAAAAARIGAFLSIDDDVADFYLRARRDPALAPHVDRLFGLHQVRFLTPFENACWAVMGQRAPIPMARRAKDAFVERFGGTIRVEGIEHRAFPEAADVAGLQAGDLRPIVRNDRRAAYLANVVDAWQDVDETWLHTGPFDEVAAWLRSIKGIGGWSTAFVLFRGLGRAEQMVLTRPNEDAMRAAYGERTDAELQAILDGYGPWAGYALLYLRASG